MNTNSIAILIKRAALLFDKESKSVLEEYNLTGSQYRVLKFLYSCPDHSVRVADIEKACSITHPTVLGLLDNLEKNGYITKTANPEDARSKLISLTDQAKGKQDELIETGEKLDAVMTRELTDREKEKLRNLLQKLLKTEVSE